MIVELTLLVMRSFTVALLVLLSLRMIINSVKLYENSILLMNHYFSYAVKM
jgi:hypothetical protein